MRKLLLSLGAAALIALVGARAAGADGPMFVIQDGAGVAHGSLRYVAVTTFRGQNTDLVEVSRKDGSVGPALRLEGQWGLPYTPAGAEGLSRDGTTLVLGKAGVGIASPSRFLVVDPTQMQIVRTISLHGYFSYDALSPDASKLYLIQYTHGQSQDTTRYIVREYDMRTNRLVPGKIAARDEDGEEKGMAGYAMTRTTSASGRWVYTLYQKPNGMPFIHALDTVHGVAHCIDLPANHSLYNIVLSLHTGGRTLAVHWRSGRPWLNVAVGSWEVSKPSGGGFPWAWVGAVIGASVALLAAGALVLRRRRRQELEQHAGQELGLA
jgi:hypothetical protein